MELKSVRRILPFGLALSATLLLPTITQAHPGHGVEHSALLSGFIHPLGGFDHLLAMVAVGLWSVQLGGMARWALPAAFVGTMLLGWAGGVSGLPLIGVELGIIASTLILGGLVLAARRLHLGWGLGLVALLALFHGYAHGVEMPTAAVAAEYGVGFVLATALLHSAGVAFATIADRWLMQPQSIRWAGGAIVLGGSYVLIQAMTGG